MRFALVLILLLSMAPPAFARLGDGPDQAFLTAARHGATRDELWLKGGRVFAETWTAAEPGWTRSEADRVRAFLVGPRQTPWRATSDHDPFTPTLTFHYPDGVTVAYTTDSGYVKRVRIAAEGYVPGHETAMGLQGAEEDVTATWSASPSPKASKPLKKRPVPRKSRKPVTR